MYTCNRCHVLLGNFRYSLKSNGTYYGSCDICRVNENYFRKKYRRLRNTTRKYIRKHS